MRFLENKAVVKLEDKDTIYYDVDDTLVIWDCTSDLRERKGILIGIHSLVPHNKHIEQLKFLKSKNCTIVVWSQGGSDWAEEVVKALKLEDYVDLIVNKPRFFFDDLSSSTFMSESQRVHYGFNEDEMG